MVFDFHNLLKTIEKTDQLRDGLQKTPTRILDSYKTIFCGYEMNVNEILKCDFDSYFSEQKIEIKEIPFFSMCEHHMLPFFGTVDICYVSCGKYLGLGRFYDLVKCFSSRLTLQEKVTREIFDSLKSSLEPASLSVVISGTHTCVSMIKNANTKIISSISL